MTLMSIISHVAALICGRYPQLPCAPAYYIQPVCTPRFPTEPNSNRLSLLTWPPISPPTCGPSLSIKQSAVETDVDIQQLDGLLAPERVQVAARAHGA